MDQPYAHQPRHDPQPEADLVARAQRGEQEAILLLLALNWRWLYRLAIQYCRRTGPTYDVDDALQDLVVRFLECLKGFDPASVQEKN